MTANIFNESAPRGGRNAVDHKLSRQELLEELSERRQATVACPLLLINKNCIPLKSDFAGSRFVLDQSIVKAIHEGRVVLNCVYLHSGI